MATRHGRANSNGDPREAGRVAFAEATAGIKTALAAGGSAAEQLAALRDGFVALVTSPAGRTLALLEIDGVPPNDASRVRRYRRLLTTALENVLVAGRASRELTVDDPALEAREWVRIADALPRWLAAASERELRSAAQLIYGARVHECTQRPKNAPRRGARTGTAGRVAGATRDAGRR